MRQYFLLMPGGLCYGFVQAILFLQDHTKHEEMVLLKTEGILWTPLIYFLYLQYTLHLPSWNNKCVLRQGICTTIRPLTHPNDTLTKEIMHWLKVGHVKRQKLLPVSGEGKVSTKLKSSSLFSVLCGDRKPSARSQTEGRSNMLLSSEWWLGDVSSPSMVPL